MPDIQKFLGIDSTTGLDTWLLPTTTGGNPSDEGKLLALGTGGTLDETVLPSGLGVSVKKITASENLSSNDIVNVWVDSEAETEDKLRVRKANASDLAKYACGYVETAASADAEVSVYFEGQFTSTSSASHLFLSITDGTAGAFNSGAKFRQLVGRRVGNNKYEFIQGDITILNSDE
jgi:hypothetical protein